MNSRVPPRFKAEQNAVEAIIRDAFRPRTVPHTPLSAADVGVPVYRFDVQGVLVSFTEFLSEVRVLFEGDLPSATVSRILEEIIDNLRASTHADWTCREVEAFTDDWERTIGHGEDDKEQR